MSKKIVLKDIQQGKAIARELASKIIADMEMYLDNDIKSEDDEGIAKGEQRKDNRNPTTQMVIMGYRDLL